MDAIAKNYGLPLDFPLQFDYVPQLSFFLCGRCHNHLASSRQTYQVFLQGRLVAFDNARNVSTGPPQSNYVLGDTLVADVICNGGGCYRKLGYKIVEDLLPGYGHREGMLYLHLDKLLYWNGWGVVPFLPPPQSQPQSPPPLLPLPS